MCRKILINLLIFLAVFHLTFEYRFVRSVQAIGFPYYKILMALGSCKERKLFSEQKLWARIKLNRIFDIYYKSHDENFKVSRVEIVLVTNNTSSVVHSDLGVGRPDFSATMYLPNHVGFVFYTLSIFTCSHDTTSTEVQDDSDDESVEYLPFYHGVFRKNT